MSKDFLDQIKQKMENLAARDKAKTDGGTSKFWRPGEGEHRYRYTESPDGDSFQEVFMHFKIGGKSFVCPKRQFGKPCAVCEFSRELFNKNTKESNDLALAYYAKPRYYSPVLVRGEEDKGIRWYSYGIKAYKEVLALMMNPEYGKIYDSLTGLDFILKYELPKKKGEFPSITSTPSRFSSPLLPSKDDPKKLDEEAAAELIKACAPLMDMLTRVSSEEARELLEKHLAGKVSEEKQEQEETESTTEKYNDKERNAIDEAFDELTKD